MPLRPIDLEQMPTGIRHDCPFCCNEVIDFVDPRLIRARNSNTTEEI